MASKDAQVTIGGSADEVVQAAQVAVDAWRNAGASITSSFTSVAKNLTASLSDVALAQGKINFASQHQQVREFEAATAHMAVAMGADLNAVRNHIEATGIAIGKRPQEVANWAASVGHLTYNMRGATEAITGMSALAAQTGRSVEDYQGLAVTLGTVGNVAGDTTHAIGVMAAQAEKLHLQGGIEAFADQIEALGDVTSHFAHTAEGDFSKVTALAAELAKGLSPQAAMRVQQGALGALAADPMRWSRYLGRDITDEHGHIRNDEKDNPIKIMSEIVSKAKRTFGKDAKRVLMLNLGAEVGAAAYGGDFAEAGRLAGLGSSGDAAKAQKSYLGTDAGKRDTATAELAKASSDLMGSSSALGKAADALQQFAAHHPLASTGASGMASGALQGAFKGIGTAGGITGTMKLLSKLASGGGSGGLQMASIGGAASGGIGAALGTAALWAGGFLAAGAAGYGAGTLIDRGTGLSSRFSGTGTHSRVAAADNALDAARDIELQKRVQQIRTANVARHRDEAGGAVSVVAPAKAEEDAERMSRAVAAAIAKQQIMVINATGSPAIAVRTMSSSPASGNQALP